MSVTKRAVVKEGRALHGRIAPGLSEYFDSWCLIGIRAGGGPSIHIHGGMKDPRMEHEFTVASAALNHGKKKPRSRAD